MHYGVRVTPCRRVLIAAVVPMVLATAACEREQPEVPEVPAQTTPADETAATRTPTRTAVPEVCEDLIDYTRLLDLVAIPMDGSNDRVYNDDDLASSGRTARLTCRYGVPFDLSDPAATPTPTPGATPTPGPPPAVVVAVSSYIDADVARGRVEGTVADSQDGGGTVSARPLAGIEAFLLADAEDVSYVLADGPLTYVFTLRRGLVPPEDEEPALVALAAEVVGVEDVPPESPTESPTGSPMGSPTDGAAGSPAPSP